MVFKLVRTDFVDPCKIQLTNGTHLLGRSGFLDCDDKRVSRSHGQLTVTDGTVVLKALHQNPCFYINKGSKETEILKQNCAVNLHNGDRFGLLPDSFWYELMHCTSPNITSTEMENVASDHEITEANCSRACDVSMRNTNSDTRTEDGSDDSQILDFALNETLENYERAKSPSVLPPENETSNPQQADEKRDSNSQTQHYQVSTNEVNSPSKRRNSADRSFDSNDANKEIKTALTNTQRHTFANEVSSPSKRGHSLDATSDSNDVNKKIKTEPEDVKPIITNGNIQGGSSSSVQNVKPEPPASPVKPANNATNRERCWYGAQCYRRNPLHLSQFSHPRDADWGTGERAPCPRGSECRTTDPRHWRDHHHPSGVQPPPPQRPGRRNKQQKRQERSREVSPDEDLNLPAKRVRKTVKRQSWSGSESENEYNMEDPFMTDEEDEWTPSQDCKSSQDYSQDV